MKKPSKDSDNLYWDHHQSIKNPTNSKTFSKLMIWFILLFSLTYFIYSLRFIMCSSPNHEPKSNFPQNTQTPIQETNLSHIVFGIAASAKLWSHRKNYIKVWWRPDQMTGAVWLDKQVNKTPIDELQLLPPIKISSDTSKFKYKNPKGDRSSIRISRIVSDTLKLGLSGNCNVRWFVMGDDDTVFIPENLVRVLSKYDHNQFYYIGSSSESHLQNINFNYGMAYGGGGFALSYPLAVALGKIQDKCIQRYPNLYGSDDRIHACMAELGVPLTKEAGFHQYDVYGNLLGLLTAHPITPFVSLHHLDIVEPIFPSTSQIKALERLQIPAKLDSAALMQQSICYDKTNSWTISVTWGYAVQIIRGVISAREMEMPARTFLNWHKRADYTGFPFNTRALSKNSCQKPFFYHLKDAEFNGKKNQTVSVYDRQRVLSNVKCKWQMADPSSRIDRVEVYKTPDPHLWDKPARRNCCRVKPTKKKGTMVIDVGPCTENEIISV